MLCVAKLATQIPTHLSAPQLSGDLSSDLAIHPSEQFAYQYDSDVCRKYSTAEYDESVVASPSVAEQLAKRTR